MKVLILSGGKGTRLGLTNIPKPMVRVAGVPLLERLVCVAAKHGFAELVFLNGHLSEVIEQHFGDGKRFGVNISHVTEPSPLGTAGAVRLVKAMLTEPFIVMYGDILLDVDLKHFAEAALANGGLGTLFVHPNDHPYDSDLLEVDERGRIVEFFPKPHSGKVRRENIVSAALYVLFPQALEHVPADRALDWGHDVFPGLIRNGESLFAYRSIEYAKDIGTPDRLERATTHLLSGRISGLSRKTPKAAVFIDRDGVLNREVDGVFSPDRLELLPGADRAVKALNDAGIPVVCVTNQPALAKGQMSWPDLRRVHAELDTQLAAKTGAYLDDVRVCPHHPEKGWPGEVAALKVECSCRKPASGMLTDAASFHGIDLSRSWMIGDRYCDLQAGKSVGTKTVLVKTGHAGHDADKFNLTPDLICDNLSDAIGHILQELS